MGEQREAGPVTDAAEAAVTRIEVRPGGDSPYPVLVGDGLLDEIAAALTGATRVALIHPRALRTPADAMRDELLSARSGIEVHALEVPDAEDAKTLQVASYAWNVLGSVGFTRNDLVIGFGGGAVTDLAGFVAATWLRGVRVVQVPTTLLGMVDAAVGGKTGIDTAAGKNLVGAFHPPAGVLCDLTALETLPSNDLVAGLAEVVKCGFIADTAILDLVEGDPVAARTSGTPQLRELVERAVRVKADVVTRDLRESFLREVLNFGHTLGHAVELVERYQWRHGAAVAVGMAYAAELGRLAGRTPEPVVDRLRAVLTALGLPTTYRQDRWPQLLEAMRRDKKSRGDLLRFVVLDDLARPARLEGPDPSLLVAAYTELSP